MLSVTRFFCKMHQHYPLLSIVYIFLFINVSTYNSQQFESSQSLNKINKFKRSNEDDFHRKLNTTSFDSYLNDLNTNAITPLHVFFYIQSIINFDNGRHSFASCKLMFQNCLYRQADQHDGSSGAELCKPFRRTHKCLKDKTNYEASGARGCHFDQIEGVFNIYLRKVHSDFRICMQRYPISKHDRIYFENNTSTKALSNHFWILFLPCLFSAFYTKLIQI